VGAEVQGTNPSRNFPKTKWYQSQVGCDDGSWSWPAVNEQRTAEIKVLSEAPIVCGSSGWSREKALLLEEEKRELKQRSYR
jgi:hypothetical protein